MKKYHVIQKIILCFIFTGSFSMSVFAGEVHDIHLKSATEYDYPPFSVTNNGEADGFSVDLLKAVMEEIGMTIEFKVDQWSVIKEELRSGELDVLPLVGYNSERDAYYDFTIPYIIMRGNIFIRKGNERNIRSEHDLSGLELIVMEGDNAHEYAVSKGWTENLVLAKTYTEAFQLLSSGRHDAVIAQGLVGEKIINELGITNVGAVYKYNENADTKIKVQLEDFEQKFCFAVKEGDSELLAKLNEGLAIVSENGMYDEIYKKWFPFKINAAMSRTEILRTTALILVPVIFILLILSIYIIRRQVRYKTALLNKQSKEIMKLSYYDSLTGVYNRRFFDEELIRLDREKFYPLTLLVADLNGLKIINDTLGHLAGDEMIKSAAKALKKACRKTDVIARWGGDEFVCIIPNSDEDYILKIIKDIKESSKRYKEWYGELSISFGYETKTSPEQNVVELFKSAEEIMYKNKINEYEGYRGKLVSTMLNTLFEKSPYDKEHSERVSQLAAELAKVMNQTESMISDVKAIGLLHDIGKIVIPQSVLEKKGPLSEEEWQLVQQHPAIGYRILSTCSEFSHIAKGVLHHHERIDGNGYPGGLGPGEIPLASKIVNIVDAYDAMTSERLYRSKVMSKEEAAVELIKNMDAQFDASIVKVFITEVLEIEWEVAQAFAL